MKGWEGLVDVVVSPPVLTSGFAGNTVRDHPVHT